MRRIFNRQASLWKKCQLLFIAAAMLIGMSGKAMAIDFKINGEWLVGFGAGTGNLYSHFRENNSSSKEKVDSHDIFEANQRVRLQLEAMASFRRLDF